MNHKPGALLLLHWRAHTSAETNRKKRDEESMFILFITHFTPGNIGHAAAKSAHSAREWPQCALPEALERGQLRSLLKVAKRGSEVDCEEISYNIISLPFFKLFLFHAQDWGILADAAIQESIFWTKPCLINNMWPLQHRSFGLEVYFIAESRRVVQHLQTSRQRESGHNYNFCPVMGQGPRDMVLKLEAGRVALLLGYIYSIVGANLVLIMDDKSHMIANIWDLILTVLRSNGFRSRNVSASYARDLGRYFKCHYLAGAVPNGW